MNLKNVTNYTFSGHESFPCRQYWLKKGFDFVNSNWQFNSPDAVIHLGVGKNMVTSIRYWLRAFNLLDGDDNLTELADRIFNEDGWDPFLEDEGTLWLLHYNIVSKGYASIFSLIFNELRKRKPEFLRKHFQTLSILRCCLSNNGSILNLLFLHLHSLLC